MGALPVGGIGAYGSLFSANAQANTALYNQGVDVENAAVARQNATITMQAGEAQTGIAAQKTRAEVGGTTANQAAGNLDLFGKNSSNVATRASERTIGSLDAATVRSNASKEAYGYQVQEANLKAQAALEGQEAKYDITEGQIGAASSMINAFAQSGSEMGQYQMAVGIGSG